MGRTSKSLVAVAVITAGATAANTRDQIRIVGSSMVFPYTQAVAEQFVNMTGAAAPIVESTGTGGGMKLFCAGVGQSHPDLTGASRAMAGSEYRLGTTNGVTGVTEAPIGYDGLSIAVSRRNGNNWDLSLEQIYLALAASVPVAGAWVENPYRKWSDISSDLPDQEILAYGPPPTSGTRDAFVELAMHAGCKNLDHVKSNGLDKDRNRVKENCGRLRLDGAFVEAGENDNLIVQRLNADATATGIFGYSFLYENLDTLKPVKVDGIAPDSETIGDFSYPISRPLYICIKNSHRGVIADFQEFIVENMSEDALGPDGYLAERGLVPLPDGRRQSLRDDVTDARPMTAR